MPCFVGIHSDGWNSHTWPYGAVVGFSLSAAVLLVLVILVVALITTQRHLLATKCRWRRGRRRVDGSSDRHDPEQTLSTDETCKRLLDPAAVTPATASVTTPCGGVEFYLKVVSPDSAGDNLSPSSVSSGDSDVKLEHRQMGDGSTCFDDDLVCATLKREILAATTGAAWDCELCHCERPSSTYHAAAAALPSMNVDESSMSNHRCSWTTCRDRRSAGTGPAAGDRTIPPCHVAAPPCVRSRLTGSCMASTSVRRPRSWCSCMHVDSRLYNDRCPSAIAELRDMSRCGDVTGNDRYHATTTLDRRCRRKSKTASRRSLQAN